MPSDGGPAPWRTCPEGLDVRVRATPRGGRDAIEGIETLADGVAVLKLRVRAVPENGAANESLRRLLAERLGLPASAVRLAGGAAARRKTFVITGDAEALGRRLAALTGRDP
ncbi:DUF167 family protein [Microvirga pudoricolor]|uniref:DUF167 family protein n=1 Tax=Microvirga pudoricolor TaxID=2778729 RepID=UPI00194DEB69|nr:DUF167 family protein [Microvirga pudoricolor]MBM6593558.1 DUF167 domain-containing protein [Microvirga pudoricolor]